MNPSDEIRAITCHCGRIACRHHPDIPAGYIIARPHPRTSTVTIEITPDVERMSEAVRRATRSIAARRYRKADA